MKMTDHSPRVTISSTNGWTSTGWRIVPARSAATTGATSPSLMSTVSCADAETIGFTTAVAHRRWASTAGSCEAASLVEHDRRHRRDAGGGQLQQVALAQVPADETRRVPDRHPGGVEEVQPRGKRLDRVVVVPVRAKDDRVEVAEVLVSAVPGTGGDGDAPALQGRLNQGVAIRDVRPRRTRDEADAAGCRVAQRVTSTFFTQPAPLLLSTFT